MDFKDVMEYLEFKNEIIRLATKEPNTPRSVMWQMIKVYQSEYRGRLPESHINDTVGVVVERIGVSATQWDKNNEDVIFNYLCPKLRTLKFEVEDNGYVKFYSGGEL